MSEEAILLAIRVSNEKLEQVYAEIRDIKFEVTSLKKEIPQLIEKERMYCAAARFFDDKEMRDSLFNTIHDFAEFRRQYGMHREEDKKKVKN